MKWMDRDVAGALLLGALMMALIVAMGAVASGCHTVREIRQETQTPVEDIWAGFRTAEAIQLQGLFLVQRETTPEELKAGIKTANRGLMAVLDVAEPAAAEYKQAQAVLDALALTGETPTQDQLTRATVALQALRNVYPKLEEAIRGFRDTLSGQ